jgi:TrmH family RNA methyltransferase
MNNLVGKYKKDGEYSYALGTTIVFELLKNNIKCDCLYVHSKFRENEYTAQIFEMAEAKKIEIINSDKIFNTLSDKENCFLIGKFKKYKKQLVADANHVVLVNISNSGNLGTIMRTSLGFGI